MSKKESHVWSVDKAKSISKKNKKYSSRKNISKSSSVKTAKPSPEPPLRSDKCQKKK